MSKSAVEFKSVSKVYGSSAVIQNLSLTIPRAQIVAIIGPSGCGKTTILKMINRLIEPSAGTVLVEGTDISLMDPVELRRNIGYVIQQIGLFPHMSIEENISIVPRLKGVKKQNTVSRTEELLSLIGLDPSTYRHRFPRELSGGQQQRIGVARALAADPSIILMDEPFSALDPISREQLQNELLKLNEAVKKTIVFVTHDMDEALKIADQIILMKDGKVIQVATPGKLLTSPKDDFVREFVGEKRFKQSLTLTTSHDVMIEVISVRPTEPLSKALELMRDHQLDGVVVTNNESKYIGIIGIREIYENSMNEQVMIQKVMRSDVPFVRGNTSVSEMLLLLKKNGGVLPVLDATDSVLGMVTKNSVLEALARQYV